MRAVLKVYYADHFVLPLPENHRFPMRKYAMLRRAVQADQPALCTQLLVPPAASDAELVRAHTPEYVQRVCRGDLSGAEIRRIGFPWSAGLVERSRRSTGATVSACRAALEEGTAVNLAGGTHHAASDAGQGFCVFNDAAVAVRAMQAAGWIERALVVDTDVHQGNGTALIFAEDPSVFTFSIHGAKNFPFHKARSDLDIALPDGTADEAYLRALEDGLARALPAARADIVVFVSGADPFVGDRLGKLALSRSGLARRDALVFEHCAALDLPVAVVMGGGYAPRIEETVAIHLETVRAAARCALRRRNRAAG